MTQEEHFENLIKMYSRASINDFYNPSLKVKEGEAEIIIDVSEKYFHSGGAIHGSVYFKMLDDVAFFAATTLERDVFVLTTSFTTYFLRPVSQGTLRSVGKVVNVTKTQFLVEAVAYDYKDREVARGSGVFVKSRLPLSEVDHYTL